MLPPVRPMTVNAAPTSADPERTVSAPADVKPGHFPRVPGYEFLAEIGSGGMGVVYKATQISLGRVVALKLIRARELANPQDQKRFVIEAEVVARLQHPNIVQVYDVGVSDAGPYYTMELLGGKNLAEMLEAAPMPFREGARLLAVIARAVEYAHAHGIVHRDLKPANILMAEGAGATVGGATASGGTTIGSGAVAYGGTPKLVDFGVAKNLAADQGLTETGKPIGTPGYMAPEQAAGRKEIGPGADVYALGVILYKFLTGRVPFEGDNLYDVLHAIITADPVSPAWYRTDVPRDLEAICLKCLRKSPAERYPSAAALAADLGRYLNHERISVGWTPPWRRLAKWCRRHPTKTTGIAAALLVMLTVAAVAVIYERRTPAVFKAKEDPAVALRREEVLRRVGSLMRTPPQPDRESPHPVEVVATLKPPAMEAYEVLSDDRVADLRAWRAVEPADPSPQAFVIFNNRRVVSKVAPVERYETRFQTSGRGLAVRGITPKSESSRVLLSTGVVGGQTMKTGHVAVDVADVPLHREFTVESVATMIDSLQRPEEQWLGLIGFKGSLRSSMLLLFPEDKPFREYQLRIAPTTKDKPEPFTDPAITFKGDGNRWLYWEVSAPKAGYVYRIDWTW